MYTLNYYTTERTATEIIKHKYNYGEEFRLRKNALNYLREIVQGGYRKDGYATETIVGGIYCIKSEKIDKGERKTIEIRIKVENA